MFARVSEIKGASERIDAGVAQYNAMVVPALKGMDGLDRAYLLVDRDGGRTLSITVWDSEEAMLASDEAANRLRAEVSDTMAAQATVSHYEIAVVEHGS